MLTLLVAGGLLAAVSASRGPRTEAGTTAAAVVNDPRPATAADVPTPEVNPAPVEPDPAEAIWKQAMAMKEAKTYAVCTAYLKKLIWTYPNSPFATKARAEFETVAMLQAAARESEDAPPVPVDAERSKKVAVVLRVKLTKELGSDKYTHQQADVIKVIKNETSVDIGKTVTVISGQGSQDGGGGLPKEECTLYVQRYDQQGGFAWMLSGGAKQGISHVSSEEKQEPANGTF
jgi:hypothetical protein